MGWLRSPRPGCIFSTSSKNCQKNLQGLQGQQQLLVLAETRGTETTCLRGTQKGGWRAGGQDVLGPYCEKSGGLCGGPRKLEEQIEVRALRQSVPTSRQVLCLLCWKGEGQARLALSGSLLARATKDQFPSQELLFSEGAAAHPGRSHCFCRGFLDQPLAFGTLLLRVLPHSLCGARFPGHKQQMVLFTLEIRLCFSQSHRCPLTASGTV